MFDLSRTAMLLGQDGVAALAQKRVAVFGIGGVGGAVCEALVRAGVGALDFVDDDVVSESNLNRQIIALHSTLGQKKVDAMAARARDINPECQITLHPVFVTQQTIGMFDFSAYDYVVDAVDTVTAKLSIIQAARAAGTPVISAMGAGNKLHPECFSVVEVEKTSVCPLARIMRKELKKRGVTGVKAVCSCEEPLQPCAPAAKDAAAATGEATPQRPGKEKENLPGSISFVPNAAGMVLAGAVVRDLLGLK